MDRRITRRGALGTALASGLAAPGRLRAAEPIRIGCTMPLSGPSATFGVQQRWGVQIAADSINAAGGLLGRPIELLFRDDRNNPNSAVAAVRELLGLGANLFCCSTISATALAVLPVIVASNAVMMNFTSVTASLNHEAYAPNYFRMSPHAYTIGRAQAEAMAIRFPEVKSWAIIAPDVGYGDDITGAYRSGLKQFYTERTGSPAVLLDAVKVAADATDYKLAINQVMATGAEGLVCGLTAQNQVTLCTQGRALGWERRFKVWNDVNQELTVARALGRNMPPSWWSGCLWYYKAPGAATAALRDAYIAATGDPVPTAQVGGGHATMTSLAAGIRAAGSTDTQAVIRALEAVTVDTVFGPVRFRPEDHNPVAPFGSLGMSGDADAPLGFNVTDFSTVDMATTLEPPSPGRKLMF